MLPLLSGRHLMFVVVLRSHLRILYHYFAELHLMADVLLQWGYFELFADVLTFRYFS